MAKEIEVKSLYIGLKKSIDTQENLVYSSLYSVIG